MRQVFIYTLLRLVVFAACFGVLYLLFGSHVPSLGIALLAVMFTSGMSLLLLRRQGAEAGRALTSGVAAVRERIDAAARKEDVD